MTTMARQCTDVESLTFGPMMLPSRGPRVLVGDTGIEPVTSTVSMLILFGCASC